MKRLQRVNCWLRRLATKGENNSKIVQLRTMRRGTEGWGRSEVWNREGNQGIREFGDGITSSRAKRRHSICCCFNKTKFIWKWRCKTTLFYTLIRVRNFGIWNALVLMFQFRFRFSISSKFHIQFWLQNYEILTLTVSESERNVEKLEIRNFCTPLMWAHAYKACYVCVNFQFLPTILLVKERRYWWNAHIAVAPKKEIKSEVIICGLIIE